MKTNIAILKSMEFRTQSQEHHWEGVARLRELACEEVTRPPPIVQELKSVEFVNRPLPHLTTPNESDTKSSESEEEVTDEYYSDSPE